VSKESERAERKAGARELYYALSQYEEDQGRLPYSERGPEYALYRLKDVVLNTDVSDRLNDPVGENGPVKPFPADQEPWPGVRIFEVDWGGKSQRPAAWVDADHKVLNVQFDYLNEPRNLDRTQPAFAVYAEKPLPFQPGRWVVFCNGAMLWISEDNKLFAAPLGKSWKELHKAETTLEPQPSGGPSDAAAALIADGPLSRIGKALWQYQEDHGFLPYSEKGGSYALYKLKPYLVRAWVFDDHYSNLENGVAYWDDENGKVDNADYEYLNETNVKFTDDGEKMVVVVAEKWGALGLYSRRVLFNGADLQFTIRRGEQNAEEPLGKTTQQLEHGSW
jgi:hypothetical protein